MDHACTMCKYLLPYVPSTLFGCLFTLTLTLLAIPLVSLTRLLSPLFCLILPFCLLFYLLLWIYFPSCTLVESKPWKFSSYMWFIAPNSTANSKLCSLVRYFCCCRCFLLFCLCVIVVPLVVFVVAINATATATATASTTTAEQSTSSISVKFQPENT